MEGIPDIKPNLSSKPAHKNPADQNNAQQQLDNHVMEATDSTSICNGLLQITTKIQDPRNANMFVVHEKRNKKKTPRNSTEQHQTRFSGR